MHKATIFLTALAFVFSAGTLSAAESAGSATGFIQNDIWFSETKPAEGDTVKIYTALFNGRQEMLSGTMAFYDAGIILGKKNFSVAGKNVATISVDWNVTAGSHAIYAEVLAPTILVAGKEQSVFLDDSKSEEVKVTVAKKVASEAGETPENTAEVFIADHLPAVIATPILTTTSAIDAWRVNTGESLELKKDELRTTIEKEKAQAPAQVKGSVSLDKDGKPEIKTDSVKLATPLAHVKLFFMQIGSYIFLHKAIFYGLAILILILIVRVVWKRFL